MTAAATEITIEPTQPAIETTASTEATIGGGDVCFDDTCISADNAVIFIIALIAWTAARTLAAVIPPEGIFGKAIHLIALRVTVKKKDEGQK